MTPRDDPVNTDGRLTRVPNQPKTPLKCFRVPTELYKAVQKKARAEGRSVSDVVRVCLAAYAKDSGDEPQPSGDGQS